MVAQLGATHCGPGTVWDRSREKCLPSRVSESDAKTCSPFTRGVRREGAVVGSHSNALNASNCAKVCLDNFQADAFTFTEGTRDCRCYNDSTPAPTQGFPACEVRGDAINVVCNGDVVALYSDKADRQSLEACNAQAARGQWLACNATVSGETCNTQPTCDPKTTKVVDGRCVATNVTDTIAVDATKSGLRVANAECVVGAPAATPISIKTEQECARRCEISDWCRTSVYDKELQRCSLVDACSALRVAPGKSTTFQTPTASSESCGPGTRLDASTGRCVLDAVTTDKLNAKNECEARSSELQRALRVLERDADGLRATTQAELAKCAARQKDDEVTKSDLEKKFMVAVGGAASADKQALQLRVELANAARQTSETKQQLGASQAELRKLAFAIASSGGTSGTSVASGTSGASATSTARMLAIQELAKAQG